MREIVEVRDLSFSYDGKVLALEDVSFQAREGEIVGVIGPNGSGKTTLLKLVLGLLKPLSGEVKVFGTSPERAARERCIGYVPQEVSPDPIFPATVGEILTSVGGRCLDYKLIRRLHLEDKINRKFSDLSGGERRIALLGMSLSCDPDLLVLDEPTAGLDLHACRHVADLLRDLTQRRKRTVLMVSHDIGFVLSIADRVLCLNRRVHYFGPPDEAPEVIEDLFGIRIRV